ncbi:hypothetical protein BT63DRAFT_417176 [Microthyrium microscopicum]|uniref:Shugoshin C-terminal domain-containing protein n=1 Tax=Microthyrium microscopicum TaxID=703497 RepID=A0A6A6U2Z7_9PEZI|nr:hypothetical protein BT63DRAFT_417176 [Microthyrium microscopicum]
MARVNELGPPAESVDAGMNTLLNGSKIRLTRFQVKRRFLRQNRELAKSNSIQSIRIRVLESEISKLLTLNAELSQENIALKVEIDNRPDKISVRSVREKLEQQMDMLSGLVSELASFQKLPPKQKHRESLARPERHELDMLEEQEGRLATIAEDKSWPRASLAEQPQAEITSSSFDSDPGPPPVALSLMPDPIQESDTIMDIPAPAQAVEGMDDMLPEGLPSNVEMRRKRRDSGKMSSRRSVSFEQPEMEIDELSAESSAETKPVIRTTLKRKLDARDDETAKAAPAVESFTFARKTSLQKSSERRTDISEKRSSSRPSKEPTIDRKPFGEKPVNTDPVVSPKKPRRGLGTEKSLKAPPAPSLLKDPPRTKIKDRKPVLPESKALPELNIETTRKTAIPESKASSDLNIVDMAAYEAALQPKTPALDLFSPPSQPSTDRPVGKDTPPPTNLASISTTTGLEPSGRPGRRARAVVNYAEPNLISKMRRPTKELSDAVGKDGRPIPGAIVKKDSAHPWQPKSSSSDLPPSYIDEAPSPLVNKISEPLPVSDASEADSTSTSTKTKRAPRASVSASYATPSSTSSTTASTKATSARHASAAVDALPAPSRRRRVDEMREAELAVYDFNESSPTSSDRSSDSITQGRAQRRHSSMTDVRGGDEAKGKGGGGELAAVGKIRGENPLDRANRVAARRRSMML